MRILISAALVMASAIAVTPAQAEFILVSNGQPRAEIVIADSQTSGPVAFAGRELQRYVKAMSGAELPVVKAPTDRPAIVITADPAISNEKPGDRLSPTSEDRYQLDVGEKRITIHGASPRAALYATYDLLERLGCGWGVPGDDTVPKRSTIASDAVKIDTTPVFSFRAMVDFPMLTIAQSTAIIDWLAKNRMNWYHPAENAMSEPKKWYEWRAKLVPEIQKRGLHLNFGGHTMHTWVPEHYFKDHPDWFAYADGARKGPALCVTNRDMTSELIRNLQKFLDRCPEVEVVDVWHPDMDAFCHCTVCTKGLVPADAKGKIPGATPGDSVKSAYMISNIEFMNRIAEALAKSHPKVYVQPLIYGAMDHTMPDGCPAPADNLLVGTAHIARDTYRPLSGEPKSAINTRYLGIDVSWIAKTKHHYIYEYYNCWVPPFIYPGAKTIVGDLRILSIVGSHGASSDLYGYSPCNMYVAARALWSPDISWEEAVRDFHKRFFGDVAQQMADNWVKLEKDIDGTNGYGSGGANYEEAAKRAGSGQVLHDARPKQIELLEGLIAKTQDPQVKVRLEREILPWKLWGEKARWWAFPKFEDAQ